MNESDTPTKGMCTMGRAAIIHAPSSVLGCIGAGWLSPAGVLQVRHCSRSSAGRPAYGDAKGQLECLGEFLCAVPCTTTEVRRVRDALVYVGCVGYGFIVGMLRFLSIN